MHHMSKLSHESKSQIKQEKEGIKPAKCKEKGQEKPE